MHEVDPSLVRNDHSHHALVVPEQKGAQGHKHGHCIEIECAPRSHCEWVGTSGWSDQFGLLEREHSECIGDMNPEQHWEFISPRTLSGEACNPRGGIPEERICRCRRPGPGPGPNSMHRGAQHPSWGSIVVVLDVELPILAPRWLNPAVERAMLGPCS